MRTSRGSGGKNKVPVELKELRSTSKPSRQVVSIYPDFLSRPDPDDIPPPDGISPAAAEAWRRKVDRYRQRGQKIDGCQDALRTYCELEVALTAMWRKPPPYNVSMINAYRSFAVEFHDTPASQRVAVGSSKRDNAFAKFGA
jgi:hypothetical protein